MYSRNTGNGWYGIPPGYNGSTFRDGMNVKHHEPDKEADILPPESDKVEQSGRHENCQRDKTALDDLIRSLSGKIGTEEMIILLVMLLTATEGVRIETILLALVLLAK